MQFDRLGHLLLYNIQEISLEEFNYFFVEKLEDTTHRRQLFEKYLLFLTELEKVFQKDFFHLIDGSFITQKDFPQDIDLVVFLPHEKMIRYLSTIYDFRKNAKNRFQLDVKFSPVCKWNHRNFEDSKHQEAYWLDLFGFSRADKLGKRNPKGIIKINFQS
jgi:hypothetical protein